MIKVSRLNVKVERGPNFYTFHTLSRVFIYAPKIKLSEITRQWKSTLKETYYNSHQIIPNKIDFSCIIDDAVTIFVYWRLMRLFLLIIKLLPILNRGNNYHRVQYIYPCGLFPWYTVKIQYFF